MNDERNRDMMEKEIVQLTKQNEILSIRLAEADMLRAAVQEFAEISMREKLYLDITTLEEYNKMVGMV